MAARGSVMARNAQNIARAEQNKNNLSTIINVFARIIIANKAAHAYKTKTKRKRKEGEVTEEEEERKERKAK